MSFLESVEGTERRSRIRFLKSMSSMGAKLVLTTDQPPEDWVLFGPDAATGKTWLPGFVSVALAAGVIEKTGKNECQLTTSGRSALRRALSGVEAYADQHRDISFKLSPEEKSALKTGGSALLKKNLNESPLARLAARKTKGGRPMLAPEEVRAGERLRADYTFAAMMPAIGQGWRTERAHGQGGRGGIGNLHDDVVAARQRVEQTLTSIEPVLAGVLVDVCCHLKGLEKIEAERGWPARCAKIVLQIGLSALADRYGERAAAGASSGRIRTSGNG